MTGDDNNVQNVACCIWIRSNRIRYIDEEHRIICDRDNTLHFYNMVDEKLILIFITWYQKIMYL
jgi:hypothetical protein